MPSRHAGGQLGTACQPIAAKRGRIESTGSPTPTCKSFSRSWLPSGPRVSDKLKEMMLTQAIELRMFAGYNQACRAT